MSENAKRGNHILAIGDEAVMRELHFHGLQAAGYEVSVAGSGKEALEIICNERIDLVVSDVLMPQMSGIQLLELLTKQVPNLPVIFISGVGNVDVAVNAMKNGASDFISKPFQPQELVARIEKALEIRRHFQEFKMQLEEMNRICDSLNASSDITKIQTEKLATMGRLVSGIAHEINNPLTAVIGYAQLLLDTGGQDMPRQLGVIKDQAQRCGKIIQDLMLFSRKRKPQMLEVDLRELLEFALEVAKEELEIREIKLSFICALKEAKTLGDPVLLKKVFSNLISNAAHALEENKKERKLEIRILEKENQMEVMIHDNGPGISSENLPKIFDPFFTTKEVGKGVGLGLSLCYGLVTEHGGKINAQSKPGEGALFTVSLPKYVKTTVAPAVESISSEKGSHFKSRKILIIEDEFFIAEFISRILSDKGIEITVANDGQKGFEAIRDNSFDLVLCDYRIPKMNGLQIFDKSLEAKKDLRNRFILVTASISFAEGPDEKTLKQKGIFYLPKPFTGGDLMKVVESALGVNSHL